MTLLHMPIIRDLFPSIYLHSYLLVICCIMQYANLIFIYLFSCKF